MLLPIAADDFLTIEHSDPPSIPGYLVVRVTTGETSLAELSEGRAAALGLILSRTSRAIEKVVRPDRVYCLSFAEIDRRLHFHLFPRTAWLLEAYWQATGRRNEPVNGPVLFEWARTHDGGLQMPPGLPSVSDVCEALRAEFQRTGQ